MAENNYIIRLEIDRSGSFQYRIEDFYGSLVGSGSSKHQTTAKLVEQVVSVVGKLVGKQIYSTANKLGVQVTRWIESLESGSPKEFIFGRAQIHAAVACEIPRFQQDDFLSRIYVAGFTTKEQRASQSNHQ